MDAILFERKPLELKLTVCYINFVLSQRNDLLNIGLLLKTLPYVRKGIFFSQECMKSYINLDPITNLNIYNFCIYFCIYFCNNKKNMKNSYNLR